MRFLLNAILILGGLLGAVIAFMSEVTVTSPYQFFDGLNVSLILGIFCVVAFIQGIINAVFSD